MLGGVVGGAALPAAPDDVDPGAGEDARGLRVVLTAVPGLVVDGRGPGAGVPGAGGEVADGVAGLMVDRPPERAGGVAAGRAGDRRGPGERGSRPGAGEPGPAVAGPGSCRAARSVPARGRLDAVAVLTGPLLPALRTPGRESSRTSARIGVQYSACDWRPMNRPMCPPGARYHRTSEEPTAYRMLWICCHGVMSSCSPPSRNTGQVMLRRLTVVPATSSSPVNSSFLTNRCSTAHRYSWPGRLTGWRYQS